MSNFLIIAGSSDIGFVTASKLIDQGHHVHLTGQSTSKMSRLANQLNVPYSILDASDFLAVTQTFSEVKSNMGIINGVVNCAGSFFLKPAHLSNQLDYDDAINANLTTAFAIVQAAGKHMTEHGGSVVLLSSAAALYGIANHEAIAAAKAAIIGLAMSAAATYASSHLRFNVVAPGLIETKLTQTLTQNQTARKASENMHALGRLGKPEDVAAAIIFFLHPDNNWITGQVLAVDGGLSRIKPKLKM